MDEKKSPEARKLTYLTVRVDDAFHRAVKVNAAISGVSIQEWVKAACQKCLDTKLFSSSPEDLASAELNAAAERAEREAKTRRANKADQTSGESSRKKGAARRAKGGKESQPVPDLK